MIIINESHLFSIAKIVMAPLRANFIRLQIFLSIALINQIGSIFVLRVCASVSAFLLAIAVIVQYQWFLSLYLLYPLGCEDLIVIVGKDMSAAVEFPHLDRFFTRIARKSTCCRFILDCGDLRDAYVAVSPSG
jgi:hypothetical protein